MSEDLNNRHNNFVYEGFDSLMREIQMHEEGQKILDKIDIYLNDMEAKIKENKK